MELVVQALESAVRLLVCVCQKIIPSAAESNMVIDGVGDEGAQKTNRNRPLMNTQPQPRGNVPATVRNDPM